MCQLVSDSRDGIRWTIVVLQNYQAKHGKRRKFNFISSESVAGVICCQYQIKILNIYAKYNVLPSQSCCTKLLSGFTIILLKIKHSICMLQEP